MHGMEHVDNETLADFFFHEAPMRITTAPAYFLVKNLQGWVRGIRLHPWDTWDKLGDRLGERLGQHIWHPSHWDAPHTEEPQMHVIVCGSRIRSLDLQEEVWLQEQFRVFGITKVYHGGASGVETHAALLATEAGIEVQLCPADWKRHGNAAGPMRNNAMLRALQRQAGKARVAVLAFPGKKGTADMVTRAQHAGVDVIFSPKEYRMPISERTALLTLCSQLHDTGIWLSLNDANALIMGPTALVKAHPELLEAVRTHKPDLLRLLEDCLAHDLYGTQTDDPRFAREVCPDCQQSCLIVTPPRRVGVHRLPGGTSTCPGSDRAQQATADTIMGAFIADRCLDRHMAVLTWYALRGALEAWCLERAFLLPPRPFLLAWLDQHYTRHGEDDKPAWGGLTLTLPEWGLDDEPDTPVIQETLAPRPKKLVLTA